MARNAVVFPLIGALAAFMAGCAVVDTGAFTRLQDEMMGLKKEMAVLKTAPPPAPVLAAERADAGDIESLRKNFADMNSDFDRVRSDQLAATTRMDEAQVELQRITARQDAQERALQEIRGNADRVKEIEKRLAALEERRRKGITDARSSAKRQRLLTELEHIYGELDESGAGPQGGGEGVAA